jgi:hypothetical protein
MLDGCESYAIFAYPSSSSYKVVGEKEYPPGSAKEAACFIARRAS